LLTGGPVLVTVGFVDLPTRQRFVRVWEDVWRRLPPDVRGTILRHWARTDLVEMHGRPRVVLRRSLPGQAAHVDEAGFVVRVALDVVADPRLGAVLAHELAHVHQAACDLGYWWTADTALVEHDAEWAAFAWGFPQP
jgi:hypothetical protein